MRGRGEHRGEAEREGGGGGGCAEGDRGGAGRHRERCWPAGPPEGEVRPQKATHLFL